MFLSEIIDVSKGLKPPKCRKGGVANSAETSTFGEGRSDKAVPLSGGSKNQNEGIVTSSEPAKISKDTTTGAALVDDTETRGCPISMVSGEELLALKDCHLPGPVPLVWTRTYRSGHSRDTGLGCGWTHSGSEHLFVEGIHVHFSDSEGRTLRFHRPHGKLRNRYLSEGMELRCLRNDGHLARSNEKR